MPRRLAALVGLAVLVGAVGSASAASAATYPPSSNTIVVQGGATDFVVGGSFVLEANGFLPDTAVTFRITSVASAIGSVRGGALVALAAGDCETGSSCEVDADSDGVAAAEVTFTEAGTTTVTASGTGTDGDERVVSATFEVADADAATVTPDTGGLANTGADLIRYGVIGLGLVAIGALIVVAFRRRGAGTTA